MNRTQELQVFGRGAPAERVRQAVIELQLVPRLTPALRERANPFALAPGARSDRAARVACDVAARDF